MTRVQHKRQERKHSKGGGPRRTQDVQPLLTPRKLLRSSLGRVQRRQVELEESQLALRGRGPHLPFDRRNRRLRTRVAPAGEVDRRATRVELLCGVEADARAVCMCKSVGTCLGCVVNSEGE